jgi:beta-lactamase class A
VTRRPSRRAVLTGAAAALLAGCGGPDDDPREPGAAPATPAPTTAAPATTPPDLSAAVASRFADLERRYDARLGLYARDTGGGAVLAHRADERFAMCSTFKAVAAAAVLRGTDPAGLRRAVRIRRADFLEPSPASEANVGGTMTLEALCAAAVQVSDNTAGNLLLREIGGPAGFTRFVRELGDDVTRLDRVEPDLNEATPGDPRDTTTPRAFAGTLAALVLGDALAAADRRLFTGWLEGTTTGDRRIRAGTPEGWRVGDKTGTGSYATANDVAILWPPDRAPIALAVLTSRAGADDERDETLLADAARIALTALTAA